ncbi:MAG: tRNA-dihydrouridine synthase family protein, partial [Paraprevotella sp.]|nr:tRNA-dihydrouridine synthase family protein [Paraprevotella sp.]
YSEFVSSDALVRMVNRSLEKLAVSPGERPVAVQIYGKDPQAMAQAARIVVAQAHPDVLDINFGCPVKKVAGRGAGSGMLRDVPLLLAVTKAVVDAVPDTPVTVKTRLGWDEPSLFLPDGTPFIVDLALRLQDCGIQALTLHGRTRAQMYTGEADWTLIGEVKNHPHMHIPVIGNGDISTAEQAEQAFQRYGVDAVMIGRATFGRPWVFHEILHPESPLTLDEKIEVLKQQAVESVERIGEYRGILHVRRHLASTPIFKGIPDFRETRIRMLRADSLDLLFAVIEETRSLLHRMADQRSV